MSSDEFERRKDLRYPLAKAIEYSVIPEELEKTLRAIIFDISTSGLCLHLFRPLDEGQEITIRSTLPVDKQAATVRWIRHMDNEIYKAGFLFV